MLMKTAMLLFICSILQVSLGSPISAPIKSKISNAEVLPKLPLRRATVKCADQPKIFALTCDSEGFYETRQFSMEASWCVDKNTGIIIDGSYVKLHTGLAKCQGNEKETKCQTQETRLR